VPSRKLALDWAYGSLPNVEISEAILKKTKTTSAGQSFLSAVETVAATGVAREHAYRPALSIFLHALLPGTTVVNEPAQIECGAPDFVALKSSIPVGHIEAKDLGADLDKLLARN
jgi:hypothetical protein